MSGRFVEVWTLLRGVLHEPEPLDMDGQLAAYKQALVDARLEARMPVTRYDKRPVATALA